MKTYTVDNNSVYMVRYYGYELNNYVNRVWLYLFSNCKVFDHLTTTWSLWNRYTNIC